MLSIGEILKKFSLKINPERAVLLAIKNYLETKKIPNTITEVKLNQGRVFIKADPYLKVYLKTHEPEVLTFLQTELNKYKINEIR